MASSVGEPREGGLMRELVAPSFVRAPLAWGLLSLLGMKVTNLVEALEDVRSVRVTREHPRASANDTRASGDAAP